MMIADRLEIGQPRRAVEPPQSRSAAYFASATFMTISQALQLALQRHREGQFTDAEALYRQILGVQADHAEAWHFLGVLAHQTGRPELALQSIFRSIAINEANPAAHSNLGEVLRSLKRWGEAVASCRRALELNPHSPEAYNNLGNALRESGDFDGAVLSFRHALLLQPHFPDALSNLGAAFADRGRLDEAIAFCRQAIQLNPTFLEAHNNLGNALRERGLMGESLAICRKAVQIGPQDPQAHNNLGNTLREWGNLDEAIGEYRHALALNPDYANAHINLGIAHKDQGEIDECMASLRRALALDPAGSMAHSDLIYALHFHSDHGPEAVRDEQRRWRCQFEAPVRPLLRPHTNHRDTDRPLRIGYVSPDFRAHVVGYNILPLLQHHDKSRFSILCYSGARNPDSVTPAFQACADRWQNTAGLHDEALAALIRKDEVDILVDLSQHLAGNRLPVFARKPAPVQISFAGYPESAGLDAIEYRISDPHLEPDANRSEHPSRERVFLIDSFWCYSPTGNEPEVNALPAIERGFVTFGNLNNFCKVSGATLQLWSSVLHAVKNSQLVMLCHPGKHRDRSLAELARHGIEPHRVAFLAPRPRFEYLKAYHGIDIGLDTFPYNGHTTSLDALWMGAPVVSLVGESPLSRAGLSQCTNLGLPELATGAPDAFVDAATTLASDLSHLAALRTGLRQRMNSSILTDARGFARRIEGVYREAWRSWITGAGSIARA